MAKKKTTTIKFNFNDKEYELGFTRKIVIKMVRNGFKIDEVDKDPISTIYDLFIHSFDMNHSDTDIEVREEILENLGDKEHLFEVLATMFSEPIEFLNEPTKNAIKWTV